MLGAIIGDIIGSRFEFNNTSDPGFELFSPECAITDDTICTVAVADAILMGDDYASTLMSWCRRYPNPKGAYGGSFSRWIQAGKLDAPYNSFGNGAAMRISAVGAAFKSEPDVIREAYEATRITHSHAEGIIGATCIARLVWWFKNRPEQALREDILRRIASEYYGPDWEANIPPRGRWDETCQGCVPLAMHIVSQSVSFEDAIRQAVAYGGDSDTLGAIVGALAEEMFGIPEEILTKAADFVPAGIKAVAREFYLCFYSERKYAAMAPFFE